MLCGAPARLARVQSLAAALCAKEEGPPPLEVDRELLRRPTVSRYLGHSRSCLRTVDVDCVSCVAIESVVESLLRDAALERGGQQLSRRDLLQCALETVPSYDGTEAQSLAHLCVGSQARFGRFPTQRRKGAFRIPLQTRRSQLSKERQFTLPEETLYRLPEQPAQAQTLENGQTVRTLPLSRSIQRSIEQRRGRPKGHSFEKNNLIRLSQAAAVGRAAPRRTLARARRLKASKTQYFSNSVDVFLDWLETSLEASV